MKLLILWILTAISVVIMAYLLPWVEVNSFGTAALVAALLGLVSITIKPILLLLTLPLNILTLGLLTFVINALMVLLVDNVVTGFEAGNFWTALIVSLVITVLSSSVLSGDSK